MKFAVCLAVFLGVASCSRLNYYRDPYLDLEIISRMTPLELDQLAGGLAAEEIIRTKRSGSGDILGTVTKSLASGVGSKLSLIGSASAGVSSFLSSSSSKGHDSHDEGYEYTAPASTSSKGYDFFSLKKSILNTLFQALKAITGGVTILKGQLIKGGGALAAGVGKIISVKGEAVTNLGRKIVNSASLSQPKKPSIVHVSKPVHSVNVHISPSAPSVPVSSYGPPSGPTHHDSPSASGYYEPSHNAIYGPPAKYTSHVEAYGNTGYGKSPTTGLQAGVILLKPLDSTYGIADGHGSSSGPSNFVNSAVNAINGIFKQPGSSYSSHSSGPGSGPSSDFSDSLYHPPPPIPSTHSSFNSYSSNVPPFKPLEIPSDHDSYQKGPINSYGVPISGNLQAMVDSLLGVNSFSSPSSDSFVPSASDNVYSKSPYSSHIRTTILNKKPGLSPVKLSKVTENLDKIKLDRSDRMRSLVDPYSLYDKMYQAKEEANQVLSTESTESIGNTQNDVESRETSQQIEEKNVEKDIINEAQSEVSSVDRSITYELRGNKIVRLTDTTDDI